MVIKRITALVFIMVLCSFAVSSYAITDSFAGVSDFRVTDDYTLIPYGALVSDIMIYKGNDSGITMANGALNINTDNEFIISTRADITDFIKEENTDNAMYEFSFCIDSLRAENLSLTAKDADGEERIICSGIEASVKKITVLLDGIYAYIMKDGKQSGISLCTGLPVFELRGKGVNVVITSVSYGIVTEQNDTDAFIESINASSDNDFPIVLEAGIKMFELGTELFSKIPECDRISVINSVKNSVPFSDETEFKKVYINALKCALGVDTSQYAEYFTDGFDGGIDEFIWNTNGNPQVREGGSDVFGGGSYCYDLSMEEGEVNTLVTGGASLSGSGSIERDIKLDKCIVKLYFYDSMKNNPASYSVMVNNALKVGAYDRYGSYVCRVNGSVLESKAVRSEGWHKMVFDTISQNGLAVYIDDIKIYENSEMSIDKLFIGNADTFASYSWFSTDNISIAAIDGAIDAEFTNRIMLVGENGSLIVKKYTKNGAIDISNQYEIQYTSDNGEVVKADKNKVTALRLGTAYVYAEALEKNGGASIVKESKIAVSNKERIFVSECSRNDNKVLVKLTAQSNVTKATLIFAVYDDYGILTELKTKELKSIKEGTAVYSIETGRHNDGETKIFLFSGLDSLIPIWKAEKVNGD